MNHWVTLRKDKAGLVVLSFLTLLLGGPILFWYFAAISILFYGLDELASRVHPVKNDLV